MKTKIFITFPLFLCLIALNSCVESPIYSDIAVASVNSNMDEWRTVASIKPYLGFLNLSVLIGIFWVLFRPSKVKTCENSTARKAGDQFLVK